ncbi:N-acetylmuramoyl-L-alanine amidase [Tumebacillus sp. ITR2]|uniref:N-acetylmuramoyl-L-alanine amidase n=1 Tax=Tumebacillus amylolyticus TaxID=2801339 RepID=A0ABS1JE74_9BACL|nr:stalk domain-containing protein [Tumebacillus amylolyticus]MBL0388599.1 N-acetylmuramoyl-L-alanine amidase [Tumebacillus amylolyticus]
MKKLATGVFALFALIGVSADAHASTPISVVIDGQVQQYDRPPLLYQNRTFVPMRGIFETLGAKVLWDGTTETVTATRDGSTVSLKLNSTTAYRNGQPYTLDAEPRLIDDRTMVPVRFVAESLGVDVVWDSESQRVLITTKEQGSTPDPATPNPPQPGQPTTPQQFIPFPYPINSSLITNKANRSYEKRTETRYLVIHETVSKTTARAQLNYFNTQTAYANAHAFIDWNEVLLTLPPDEIAWSVGKPANAFTFNIELCHVKTASDFAKEWEMATTYAAKWCLDANRDPMQTIVSHHDITNTFGGTTHTDPDEYFNEFHKTMNDFRQDVANKINTMKAQGKRWQ